MTNRFKAISWDEVAQAGLTNAGTEDLGVLASSRAFSYDAYCESKSCCKIQNVIGDTAATYVKTRKKSVPKNTTVCPDCGCALIWKRGVRYAHKECA